MHGRDYPALRLEYVKPEGRIVAALQLHAFRRKDHEFGSDPDAATGQHVAAIDFSFSV